MRLLIFIALLLAFDVYAFQAFRSMAQGWPPVLRNTLYIVYWMIPAALAGWMAANASGLAEGLPKSVVMVGRAFFFIAYLSKALITGVLLIDDLRRGAAWGYQQLAGTEAVNPGRSRFMVQLGLGLAAIPFFSLIYGMVRNPYRYRLFREQLPVPGLPKALDGLKIIQISDIHTGSFLHKEPVRNAVDLINAQQPDLVFFTGDLVNNTADEATPYIDVFDKIQARYGVYSVLGNHDYGDYVRWPDEAAKRGNMEQLLGTHRQMGWEVLLNENRLLDIRGEQVAIIGVENYSAHPRFPKYGDLEQAYAGAEGAGLKLLLSHDPSHWEDQVVKTFKDIALTFSGHTHGMQFGVEIPGWLKWSPIKYVYKQWAGLYQSGGQYLYVNRGLGYLGYPGRVGILPEVTCIELKAADA